MTRIIGVLSRPRVLVALLIAMIAIALAFGHVNGAIGGPLLDMISGAEANRARLAGMDAGQRSAHLWVTLTLDMAYPLVYAPFFGAFAARFAGRFALAAALPAIALLAVDVTENMVIVAMLLGNETLFEIKSLATLLKWWLFGLTLAVAAASGLSALVRHFAGVRAAVPAER